MIVGFPRRVWSDTTEFSMAVGDQIALGRVTQVRVVLEVGEMDLMPINLTLT